MFPHLTLTDLLEQTRLCCTLQKQEEETLNIKYTHPTFVGERIGNEISMRHPALAFFLTVVAPVAPFWHELNRSQSWMYILKEHQAKDFDRNKGY